MVIACFFMLLFLNQIPPKCSVRSKVVKCTSLYTNASYRIHFYVPKRLHTHVDRPIALDIYLKMLWVVAGCSTTIPRLLIPTCSAKLRNPKALHRSQHVLSHVRVTNTDP